MSVVRGTDDLALAQREHHPPEEPHELAVVERLKVDVGGDGHRSLPSVRSA
jgi:hypothetical protein